MNAQEIENDCLIFINRKTFKSFEFFLLKNFLSLTAMQKYRRPKRSFRHIVIFYDKDLMKPTTLKLSIIKYIYILCISFELFQI